MNSIASCGLNANGDDEEGGGSAEGFAIAIGLEQRTPRNAAAGRFDYYRRP
jgi:hypothetical protein